MEGDTKAKFALTFAIYRGDELLRREKVAQDIVKVGKDPRSHLRVDDELSSRMHAVIEVASPNDVTLIDLGNEPGTQVNGQRVNKCKLKPGDAITIGGTRILLEAVQEAGAPSEQTQIAPVPVMAASEPPPASAGGSNPFAPVSSGGAGVANPFAPAASAGAGIANPFAAPPAAPSSSPYGAPPSSGAVADGGQYTYSMIKSMPAVLPSEVEVAHASTVEVTVLWDTNVLAVRHLTPPRSFYIGEEGADYAVPSETIGSNRAPIVVVRGGEVAAVVPEGASGYIEREGRGREPLRAALASGGRPSAEWSGAQEITVPAGAKVRVELPSGLAFQIAGGNAGRAVSGGVLSSLEAAVIGYFALSFLFHVGLIVAVLFFRPRMGFDSAEDIDRDKQVQLLKDYLNAAAEREQEQQNNQDQKQNPDQKEGGTGTRAKGEEGSMGNPTTKDTNKRYGVQGPKDNPDPHLAKQAALQEAANFGMVGLLNAATGADPNAPTAPWGRDDSSGVDDKSARGNMFGDAIGDAFGAGGLGLMGTGEGGGGHGEGIGLGNFGGLGHGAGTGTGQGIGGGRGGLGRGHSSKGPRMREGGTSVNGRLPPEVIQRIVRQNFGRFRVCYESGLRNNPTLQGRVAVRFVIDRNGGVSMTADGGSDLPDPGVRSCVVRAFGSLSFPQPEGGVVTVVYPIVFSPGD